MTKLYFLRRPMLGMGSIRGITAYLENIEGSARALPKQKYQGLSVSYGRSDDLSFLDDFNNNEDYLIRWGCTTNTSVPLARQVNRSESIHLVNDKIGFRMTLREDNLCPPTYFPDELANINWSKSYVLRPGKHAQGRNFHIVSNRAELDNVLRRKSYGSNFYVSEFIQKEREFRVYFVNGMVICVAEKIPQNKSDPAWNHALGSTFVNVGWTSWPMSVITNAKAAFDKSELQYGGVDVILGSDDRAWTLEINSAASLPLNNDGTPSYRQKCFAKAFRHDYVLGLGQDTFKRKSEWAQYIHAGVWSKAESGE